MTNELFSLEAAQALDAADPLAHLREQFVIPQHNGHPVVYGCGNSLGLQPKAVRKALEQVLDQWAEFGVEGHFLGERPWMYYHKLLTPATARLVGAKEQEVVVMNTLTVNLHLMMVTFYRPTATRYKIVMEAGAFPSDQYAVESQVRFHGLDPDVAIVEIPTDELINGLPALGDDVALVMVGGVNYYTGQFYDLKAITAAAHRAGAYVGFDLAHAAGNLPLQLHDWGPDFAVWCSYKYLNSGPGGPSGAFVHERHANNPDLPRFAGWWGHDEGERFKMRKGFKPMYGAEGWQLSNAQVLASAAHLASLELFDQVGMAALRAKSLQLTARIWAMLAEIATEKPGCFQVITPADPDRRGCQLSVLTDDRGRALFDVLSQQGIICDWREPNVVRFAPVPMYNSFEDVYRIGQAFKTFYLEC